MFSVRIVTTDHYMSSPIPGLDVQYADQRGSEVKKVPVVRIFGATPAGQKTCMHVHGVFPYLYVPYDGTVPWDRYLRQFATSLDKAINVAQGQGQSTYQHVYKIVLVTGMSMYGYHEKDQQFLKIFLYNPQMIRKAADLLLGGAVLNKPFQPHESHIPYTLQLFIDYNLYGMNMINVAAVKFRQKNSAATETSHMMVGEEPGSQGSGSDVRSPTSFTALLNRSGTMTPSRQTWEPENIPSEYYLDSDVERLSTCDLEVDVVAADILNRLEVTANVGANPGLTALWEDEKQRRTERGESTDIAPPQSPGRVNIEPSDSETILRDRLRQIIQDLQPYIDSQSDTEPEESQEDDIPMSQASHLDLHTSQDFLAGSQDTMDVDDDEASGAEGEEAVVNVASIQRIVSHSQSFCDVRLDRDEASGTSQDRSLVDILAALADDHSSPPASQEAAARVLALEEQDSILSQTTSSQPLGDQEGLLPGPGGAGEEEDEVETLEMSQRVWEGDGEATKEGDYDLLGMDDTWVDSQAESPDPGDSADDSDADSDIIPQYDGSVDEQPHGSEMKNAVTKRLGMRGPAYNMAVRDMAGQSPALAGQFDNRGSMANYGQMYADYQGYPNPQQMQAGPRQMVPYGQNSNAARPDWGPMYNQSGAPWPRGMYPQQQQGRGMPGSMPSMQQQHPGMQQPHDMAAGTMQVSPGSSQSSHGLMKSPRSLQQMSPGSMHLDISQSPRSMKLSPGSMTQSPGSVPHSPDSMVQSPVYMPHTHGHTAGSQQQQASMMQQSGRSMSHASPPGSQQPSPVMNQYAGNSPVSQHGPRFPQGSQGGYSQYGGPRYYSNNQQYPQQQMMDRRYMTEAARQQAYSQPVPSKGPVPNMAGYQPNPGQFGHQRYADPSQHGVGRLPHPAAAQAMNMFAGRQQQRAQATPMSTSQNLMRAESQQMPSQTVSSSAYLQRSAGSCMITSPGQGGHNITPSVTKENMMIDPMSIHMSHDPMSTTKASSESFMSQRTNQMGNQSKQSPHFPSSESQPHPSAMLSSMPSHQQSMSAAGVVSHSPSMETGRYVVKRPRNASSSPGAVLSPVEQNPNVGAFQGIENHRLGQDASKRTSNQSHDPHMKSNVFQKMQDLSPSSQHSPGSGYGMQTQNRMYQPSAPPFSHNIAQSTAQSPYPISTSGQFTSDHSGMSSLNMPTKSATGMMGNRDMVVKPPDNYSGPVSRYFAQQKKHLMYEQISPPVTPGLGETDSQRSNIQAPPGMASTPSSAASDTQFSPLQKLLLEPTTPTTQKQDHPGQRSLSRSSLSSVSSANSERFSGRIKPSPDTGQGSLLDSAKSEPLMSTPDRKSTDKGFGGTKLYNLLAGNSSQGENVAFNVQTNLNDSQQDLFADSLLNSPTDGNASNLSLFASDNSLSNSDKTHSRLGKIINDNFESQILQEPQKPTTQGKEPSQQFSITSKPQGQNSKTKPDGSYGSLSNLQNFVGSVRQDTDYGVSFMKKERAFSVTTMPQSQHSFLSQLNDFEDVSGGFPQQQQSAGAQPQRDYNVSNWPKHEPVDPNKPGRSPTSVSTAKKRGRPPLKKSVSVPGAVTTMGKRKRGRPRKNSVNFIQSAASYPSHTMMTSGSQQFPMSQTMGGFQGSSISNQYQTYPPGHQSFQQMLEDQGDQLPLDTGFVGPMVSDQTQGPTMSQGPPESLVASQPSHLAQSSQFQCNVQYQQGFQTNMQQSQQQSVPGDFFRQDLDFPQQQQSMPQSSEGFMTQTSFAPTVDMSQLYTDSGQSSDGQTFLNMDTQSSENTGVSNQEKMADNCSQMSQDFRLITLQSITQQNTLVQHNDASRASAVTELIQYRIRPPPKPSPAYTYRFKLPTQVYKRMKIYARMSDTKAIEFVRMHPKDARKYSLLKIGREIVKLKNLPARSIIKLQEDIKAGIHIEAIPPTLRAATLAEETTPKASIIANLLSCDSPTPEESVDTSQASNMIDEAPAVIACESSEAAETVSNQNVVEPNQIVLDPNQTGVDPNQSVIKKQRRSSETKNKNMFKGNIANIPHLKKYRAGFSYFGKGHVGKGTGKVRQNHPILGPDFEDDENIVLKDVSLNEASEGTLTPIKSRTPIAGRSPAHSGGPMSEIENQDKEILDSKLKSLELELDLNQSNNSQMFQDELFTEKEDIENSEYDGSTEEESDDDSEMEETDEKQECESKKCSESKEGAENASSDLFETSEASESNMNVNGNNELKNVKQDVEGDITDMEIEESVKNCDKTGANSEMKIENECDIPKCQVMNHEKAEFVPYRSQTDVITETSKAEEECVKSDMEVLDSDENVIIQMKSELEVNSKDIVNVLKTETCRGDTELLSEIIQLNGGDMMDNQEVSPTKEIDSCDSDINKSDSVDGSVDVTKFTDQEHNRDNKDEDTKSTKQSQYSADVITSNPPYNPVDNEESRSSKQSHHSTDVMISSSHNEEAISTEHSQHSADVKNSSPYNSSDEEAKGIELSEHLTDVKSSSAHNTSDEEAKCTELSEHLTDVKSSSAHNTSDEEAKGTELSEHLTDVKSSSAHNTSDEEAKGTELSEHLTDVKRLSAHNTSDEEANYNELSQHPTDMNNSAHNHGDKEEAISTIQTQHSTDMIVSSPLNSGDEEAVNTDKSQLSADAIILSHHSIGVTRTEDHPDETLALCNMSKQLCRSRSRSSSCESYCASSRSGSRRSSLTKSTDNLKSEFTVRGMASSETLENKTEIKRKKKSSCSASSASGSKSSRSSSVDKDYKRRRPRGKKKKKAKKRNYRTDSDSDGIPGVDYIVVGRFKGHREMRVLVDKLALANASETVNVNEFVENSHGRNSNGFHSDTVVLQESRQVQSDSLEDENLQSELSSSDTNAKSFSTFSSEFEKFLVQQGTHISSSQTSQPQQSETKFPQDPFLELRVEGGNSNDLNKIIVSESNKETPLEMDVDIAPELKSDGSAMIEEELANSKSESKVSDVSIDRERDDKDNGNTNLADMKEDTADKLGDSKMPNSCCCVSVCNCDVNVKDCSGESSGIKDMSSTSDGEKEETQPQLKKPKTVKPVGDVKKKRKNNASNRLGNAFCSTRSRRKKNRPKCKSSKLMCTLSVLHDATMEKLTYAQVFGESPSTSPVKMKDQSDTESPVKQVLRLESPDFELYTDKTNDYRSDFTDTMYQLAYYSPPLSLKGNDSPPQPLSPDEVKMSDESTDCKKEAGKVFAQETMENSILQAKDKEINRNGFRSDMFDTETLKESPVKTAVAKEAPMTLKDIMSMSKEDVENAHGLPRLDKEVSSPPDLGPPVMESYSPDHNSTDDNSPPPYLTPSRQTSQCDDEAYLSKSLSPIIPDLMEDKNKNMPLLTPCRSPRIPLSPRQGLVSDKSLDKSYSSIHSENEGKAKPGRSSGAASSTGSINVVHSEQFSDISDESEVEEHISADVTPISETMSESPQQSNYENISPVKEAHLSEEQKRKEIKEFEERLKKSDENRNNIFELFKQNDKFKAPQNDICEQQSTELITPLDFSFSELSKCQNPRFENKWSNDVPQDCCKKADRNHRTSPFAASQMNMEIHDNIINRPSRISPPKDWRLQRNLNYSQVNGHCSLPEPGEIRRDFHGYTRSSSIPFPHTDIPTSYATDFTPRNIFDNFSTSSVDKSIVGNPAYERGANSGDLFDSLYHSNHSVSVNSYHSHPPSFTRSLSDSFRPDYSIIRDRKINDSIMRAAANHMSIVDRHRFSPSHYQHNGAIPILDLHGGRRKHQRKNSEPSYGDTSSHYSQPSQGGVDLSMSGSRSDSRESAGRRQPEQDRRAVERTAEGCQVIMPLSPPPSKDRIHQSAFNYGLPSVPPRPAFYGDYRDAPDKPREGTAHGLKVPSTLVKDLEEFETTADVTGLQNWRAVFCLNDSLLASQEGTDTIQTKLQKEPALKYALTGDQSVIITPCLLPPSKDTVNKWCKGRKLYKDFKDKAVQKIQKEKTDKTEFDKESKETEKTVKDETKKTSQEVIESERKSLQCDEVLKEKPENKKDSGDLAKEEKGDRILRLNLFTGKRERVDEEGDDSGASDSKYTKIQKPKTEEMTESAESPDADRSVLHSTPVLRRASTDLFEPTCTPITSSGRRGSQEADAHLSTPKRRMSGRLSSRRLSTHSESTLRQAILTSQMKHQFATPVLQRAQTTQIEGPSLKNSFGFRVSQQNLQDAKAIHEFQHLTTLSVELHVETRGNLRPDPEIDNIQAIFYTLFKDVPPESGTRHETGIFMVDRQSAEIQDAENQPSVTIAMSDAARPGSSSAKSSTPGPSSAKSSTPGPSSARRSSPGPSSARESTPGSSSVGSKVKVKGRKDTLLEKSGILGVKVVYVKDETELIQKFIDFIHKHDPDILVGYEIQMLSWGFLLQRASTLSLNMAQAISRVPSAKRSSHHSAEKDEFGADHMSEIHIAGRIVLNLWRILKHEVTLNVYSFENVVFHVLHKRIPLYPFRSLTAWFKHRTHVHRWKVVEHYVARVQGTIDMIEQLDLIGRTSEFARVFGIEFYHVLSRGSQYRVESMMLRVAKPLNYIPTSPSVHQRARMKAPECIALTLEPESRFYTDPVVVLDFQSLYPSIMIAYNYCFTTCLGRLEWFQKAHEGPIELGCVTLDLPPSVIQKNEKDVTISPNGVVFCTSEVKRGVLGTMVEEILNTRLMIKKAMGSYKGDKTLSRILHARQLGLKLIANVTYGYTAANFSGRMPCIEVGDSIVRKARETLERSIKLVEETPRWGARVIYGDTDSMFLLLKGRSKDEAFKIGQEIADTVTKMFPKPIKLKFEKVYLPCVLQTKKRYVGYMYETPNQKEPVYDAKGIETVRRDSCSAVSKILEQSIKTLFTTHDVSAVKRYVQKQFQKIMEGTVSLQDFIFAKEYRGMPGYKPGACVPALEISKKMIRQDKRSEPRVGERVPYIIVYGSPGLPLIQLVRQPLELITDPSLRLNSTYYITKQILPPLDRFLFLLGVDVFSWYQAMPHSTGRMAVQAVTSHQAKKGTISQYFATSNCPICEQQTKQAVCAECMKTPQSVCVTLNAKITQWERVHRQLQKICGACTGCSDPATFSTCVSLDCPVLYRTARAADDLHRVQGYRDILDKVFK